MSEDRALLRLGGAAAIVGGILRLAAAWPDLPLSPAGREMLYFLVDLVLVLGLIGLFGGLPRFRSWLGWMGFVGAVAGFLMVRTGDRLAGPGSYMIAASVVAAALALAGLSLITAKGLVRYTGAAWIASFLVAMGGVIVKAPGSFLVASLLFCLGFILGGVALVREQPVEA
jgi:hypothetical protein